MLMLGRRRNGDPLFLQRCCGAAWVGGGRCRSTGPAVRLIARYTLMPKPMNTGAAPATLVASVPES